jgi:hypothetical protein
MGLMDHLHVKMWPQIIRIWRMCIRNLVACSKTTYQLVIMQVKIALWKPHNQASILGFFVVNDDLLMDLENSQMCNLCYL